MVQTLPGAHFELQFMRQPIAFDFGNHFHACDFHTWTAYCSFGFSIFYFQLIENMLQRPTFLKLLREVLYVLICFSNQFDDHSSMLLGACCNSFCPPAFIWNDSRPILRFGIHRNNFVLPYCKMIV